MKKIIYIILILVGLTTFFTACTEPYPINSEYFEENIVIEASITNRLEKQRIKVAKTYPVDSTTYQPSANGVSVKLIKDQSTEYTFSYQEEDSTFVSDQAFQAEPNIQYTLKVATANDVYTATSMFESSSVIDSLSVQKATNEEGIEGLRIALSSTTTNGSNTYYRFKFEETYKITAPYYSPYKADFVNIAPDYFWYPPEIIIKQVYDPDIYHQKCYRTEYAKKAILANTEDLTETNLQNFPIKFIPKTDYKLNERYSIHVTQYTQSFEAYKFYETLNDLSSEGNILSPNQPGFVEGNIQSVNFPDKKVVGFFEVVSASSKRVYFNHQDFFPNETIPEYFRECPVKVIDKYGPVPPGSPSEMDRLKKFVRNNQLILWKTERFINDELGYQDFYMVPPECGDCAVLGNPEPPEFWEE